ncbi:GntR family transcriptional regulator [Altericroceibacterium spongiae]|uniref:GntR family transcriptional regulator n=1 Tax=Altericroceibacterium spongiae TaxID=2320269 RepID=A0A420EE08_9SPHN|nr:GntR family transcriptional regulator [Altericroceibacterium spongiae]RKF18911.1 GntR family transcriptional regulator [Altericroceibacterium spongiae]
MSIVVRTLSEQVLEVVRDRIITGQFPTGKVIRQDALATELGVSKIPLREALARLEQEGLLKSQANRGYFVQPMSIETAEEIFELRLSIEPGAAGHAALVAGDKERKAAIAAFEALDEAMADKTGSNVAVCNRAFHTALVTAADREITKQLIERLAIQAERYVVAHLQPSGRGGRADEEHRQMLDAWLARDDAKTSELLASHIQGTLDDLRAELALIPVG